MPCTMESQYLLQTPWTIWYDCKAKKNASTEEWQNNLHKIVTVTDVPTMLYAIENIEPLSTWPVSSNIHLFREDIGPAWEDKYNIGGGKWVFEIMKGDETVDLQEVWKKTVSFCISECIPDELICGAVFSARKYVNRFAIWTNLKDDSVLSIGKEWKELIGLENYPSYFFRSHQDNLEGGQYWTKNIYSLD